MVIGAAKSGTTSLCYLLGSHPNVFMVPCKEPNFFSRDEIYAHGFQWYESLYEQAGNKRMRGEGSQLYTIRKVFPKTASRIAQYSSALKLIYIVRHPIERIESGWVQMRFSGNEIAHYSLDKAVKNNRIWLVDSTNYWQEINRYRDYFPDENILVVFFEDFKTDYRSVVRRCFEFLGVDPQAPIDTSFRHLNPCQNKEVPRAVLSVARSFPYMNTVLKLLPGSFRNSLGGRFFFKRVTKRPRLKPRTQKWVADELQEDIMTFLQFYGKPFDYWDLYQ